MTRCCAGQRIKTPPGGAMFVDVGAGVVRGDAVKDEVSDWDGEEDVVDDV